MEPVLQLFDSHTYNPNAKGRVYFIHQDSLNLTKIGRTDRDTHTRIKELQTGNPIQLRVICDYQCDNPVALESQLHKIFRQHKKFEEHQLQGEWFNLPDGILDGIDDIVRNRKTNMPYQSQLTPKILIPKISNYKSKSIKGKKTYRPPLIPGLPQCESEYVGWVKNMNKCIEALVKTCIWSRKSCSKEVIQFRCEFMKSYGHYKEIQELYICPCGDLRHICTHGETGQKFYGCRNYDRFTCRWPCYSVRRARVFVNEVITGPSIHDVIPQFNCAPVLKSEPELNLELDTEEAHLSEMDEPQHTTQNQPQDDYGEISNVINKFVNKRIEEASAANADLRNENRELRTQMNRVLAENDDLKAKLNMKNILQMDLSTMKAKLDKTLNAMDYPTPECDSDASESLLSPEPISKKRKMDH